MGLTHPNVEVHEIVSGNNVSGVRPVGATLDRKYSGREDVYALGTDGGLLVSPELVGVHLKAVFWYLPGGVQITVSLVDSDDFEYPVLVTANESGTLTYGDENLLIPPNWKVKVDTGLNNLSANGRLGFILGSGWGTGTLDQRAELQEAGSRVPGPPVP